MNLEYIVILGIDIGEKNFAIAKERYNIKLIDEIKKENIMENLRYDKNGECTTSFAKILRKMSTIGERVFYDKMNLTSKEDKKWGKKRIINNKFLVRLTNYLEDLNEKKVYDDVHYFIIENQLKRADNNRQIQFHVRAYLIMLFLNFRPIISFQARHKTEILGAPKQIYDEKEQKMIKMKTRSRKLWASERAFNILSDRNDIAGLDTVFSKKSDDISDCILMIQAFVYMVFIDDKKNILDA
jgi:hypothetical protein